MEKINIAELLKDCPKGMELDCTMFENTFFDCVTNNPIYPIRLYVKSEKDSITFTAFGCTAPSPHAKCVIFPKGKTTWEGFHRPFKDGDIVTKDKGFLVACIYKERKNVASFNHHVALYEECFGVLLNGEICSTDDQLSFATEEEKQKLFDAIKENGYRWDNETKTLEKLIGPKFKVGDKIKPKTHTEQENIVTEIKDTHYILNDGSALPFIFQDEYELVHDKFDITTLVPFESRVLVRNDEGQYWIPAFWGCKRADGYTTTFGWCKYCIPFEENEHLLETNNDCNEYYKTWK